METYYDGTEEFSGEQGYEAEPGYEQGEYGYGAPDEGLRRYAPPPPGSPDPEMVEALRHEVRSEFENEYGPVMERVQQQIAEDLGALEQRYPELGAQGDQGKAEALLQEAQRLAEEQGNPGLALDAGFIEWVYVNHMGGVHPTDPAHTFQRLDAENKASQGSIFGVPMSGL